MERPSSDKEQKSSKRSRDDDHYKHRSRDRDREYRDSDSHRRHRHHKSSKRDSSLDRDEEPRRERSSEPHRHHHRSEKDRDRDHYKSSSKREGSRDRDEERRRERSSEPHHKARDREEEQRRERSIEPHQKSQDREEERKRERSSELQHKSRDEREGSRGREIKGSEYEGRRKRKEREEEGLEEEDKKRRERRRLGEKVKKEEEEEYNDGYSDDFEGEKKGKFVGEVTVKEEEVNGGVVNGTVGTSNGDVGNGAAMVSFSKPSRTLPEASLIPLQPHPTKVSSISNTNENRGVSVTRSHEVPGNSSTDGTSSAAGKSGSLSLDALAKAKKALQMQKELSEKLKKLPQLSKSTGLSGEGLKAQSSTAGVAQASNLSAVPATVSVGTMSTPFVSSTAVPSMPDIPGLASNYEVVKRAQELAAKMGFRQDPQFAPLINLFPGQMPPEASMIQKPTKAPVLRVDALGREIDEHGNVVNLTKPSNLSTLKVNINKQKKEAFQILKPELDMDPQSNPHFDPRMGVNKTKLLRPKRMTFQFVEEGKWSKEAEIIRFKHQFGEESAKDMKARQALHAKAKAAPDINPNLIEVGERVITKEKPKELIPEIEWWDVSLLVSGNYPEIDGDIVENQLKMDKITIYVEHPRPIEPPAEPAPPPPQPLKLTKKEQKKLRTQRRLAREKDRQEMIRQGLIEPPKPKVKMSNLMKVLGSEATQDPTKLEKEIRMAAAEREQAHIDRNIARKLTPAERRDKKERKLFDDPNTLETIVSVYRINHLSDKKTHFKVDVNAHENRLTGCCVISEGITIVVVEGGSKSIKRYGKLMLRRINWAEAVNDDEDGDDAEEKPPNKCSLVWQGSVAKPSFNRFLLHECMTEVAARKIFADAGVGHYWDLAVNFSEDQ